MLNWFQIGGSDIQASRRRPVSTSRRAIPAELLVVCTDAMVLVGVGGDQDKQQRLDVRRTSGLRKVAGVASADAHSRGLAGDAANERLTHCRSHIAPPASLQ